MSSGSNHSEEQNIIWKPIIGWEDKYEISSDRQVRNKKTKRCLKIDTRFGWDRVVLSNPDTTRNIAKLMRLHYPTDDLEGEIWKPLDGYLKYDVSNEGRIRNKNSLIVLSPFDSNGYPAVGLYNQDGASMQHKVHILIAKTFIPKLSDDKIWVNHIDGNKYNSKASNLEWVTPKENVDHARRIGLAVSYTRAVNQLDSKTGKLIATFPSAAEAGRSIGISGGMISGICAGSSHCSAAGGFGWSFVDPNRPGRTEQDMKDLDGEEWKLIDGSNYRVSTMGRVANDNTGHMLSIQTIANRRQIAALKIKGERKHCHVHRLVAEAFIPNPLGLSDVDHIDEDPSNNRLTNLRWLSSEDNNRYSHAKPCEQLKLSGTLIRRWASLREASLALDIHISRVADACHGKIKTCAGFIWRFVESETQA